MNIRFNFLSCLFSLFFLLFIPQKNYGQVDPEWLKMWNVAFRERPVEFVSQSRISSLDEPGIPFTISGQIFDPKGETPVVGAVVHAYHRDEKGYDFGANDRSNKTWRLQGWAITDSLGRFVFSTIRPGADFLGREGAHIHFTIITDEFGRQWAPTVYLLDDPKITIDQIEQDKLKGRFTSIVEVRTVGESQSINVKIKLKKVADF